MTQEVSDKKLELGSMATNIILFLILAVMGWVGLNIEKMRDDITTMAIASSNNSIKIDNLSKRMDQHILEKHGKH